MPGCILSLPHLDYLQAVVQLPLIREHTVSYHIPYTCQYASPELVRAFIYGERETSSDPRWADYGANSSEEYAHWALRSCGVVCVKMAVEGITGQPIVPVMDWVRAGLALDGYLVELRADRKDRPIEKGWKHNALVQLARQRGCQAELATRLTLDEIAAHIQANRIVIASVSSELGEAGPITRRSGHLVVIYGVVLDEHDQTNQMILHNPSGRTAPFQQGARIPAARFIEAASGRGIIVSARPG